MYPGERFNAGSHLVGALLALTGSIWLIVLSSLDGDPWKIVGVSVYGATLLLLYTVSTVYHSVRGRAKRILRKLDHLSIYLLIAGSYTPFCLVTLNVLIAIGPLLRNLGGEGFAWLLAGGVVYTAGIVFFVYDTRYRHWHGIWHLFVVGGSSLHFVAIGGYVI